MGTLFSVPSVRALCVSRQRKGEIPQTTAPRVPQLRAHSRKSCTHRAAVDLDHRGMNAIPDSQETRLGKLPLSAFVNLALAILLSAWSGFFTMDFILSGAYTWPRSSRVMTLTFAVIILVYEFIYKEHQTRHTALTGIAPLKVVCYACMIPYILGILTLLALINFS